MKFNLNRFLGGLSLALDCVESELLGATTQHGLRVAYISMRMGQLLGLAERDVFDLAALAVLHDNGLTGLGAGLQSHPAESCLADTFLTG
ncbi:MAG: phosphohydrolase, partial [Magnetococcales bacterium]|nr:phosphohydrolase [Magnetococcales bacterium]